MFIDRLRLEWADSKRWRVTRSWTYQASDQRIVVWAGYLTDFASVPRVFQGMLPATGGYTQAAVLHDFLCDHGLHLTPPISRYDADGIFRRVMREHGVLYFTRWVMWAAVRLPGIRRKGIEAGDWRILLIALGPGLLVAGGGIVAVPFILAFFLLEFAVGWMDNRRLDR